MIDLESMFGIARGKASHRELSQSGNYESFERTFKSNLQNLKSLIVGQSPELNT